MWEDPRYLRIHARKDAAWKDAQRAELEWYRTKTPRAKEAWDRALRAFDRIVRRMHQFEDRYLAARGASW